MNKTILLIDHDVRFCAFILLSAAELNCELFQCTCLKEASSLIRSSSFDLLIVDKDMPDGDGLAWLRDARKIGVTAPAIFISACVNDGVTFKELLDLDVCLILQKPVSMPTLKEEIGILLGQVGDLNLDERTVMEQLEKIKAEFAKELPLLLGTIRAHIQKARFPELNPSALREAARHAHVLRGTAAIFGFEGLARKISFLEDELRKYLVDEAVPLDAAILEQHESFVAELLSSPEAMRPGTPLFRALRCRRMSRVLGFSTDSVFSMRLKQLLSAEHIIPYIFNQTDSLRDLILEIEPALVIFDSVRVANELKDCLKVCSSSRIPAAIVMTQEMWNERDFWKEAQACILLDKQMSNLELISKISNAIKAKHRPLFGSIKCDSSRNSRENSKTPGASLSIA